MQDGILTVRTSRPATEGLYKVERLGFGLGSRQGISFQVLERTPPLQRTPNVSPATCFGARRPAFAENIVDPPTKDCGVVEW